MDSSEVKLLGWDTSFFEFSIAQISSDRITSSSISEIMEFCRQRNVRLLQFKCDAHDRSSIRLAESSGFHFVDTRVILERSLPQVQCPESLPKGVCFRIATVQDLPSMMSMTENLYTHSRYYFDAHFPVNKVNEFYRDWVRKAVTGEFDDMAWVLLLGKTIVAFCSVRIEGSRAVIGLVGLDPTFAGRGFGRAVVNRSLAGLVSRGCHDVKVVTQGRNYPAQRLYHRAGFLVSKMQIYYHCWFDSQE